MMGTLLGVSYDAVRRCTFAGLLGRCYTSTLSGYEAVTTGDCSMSSSCDYRSDQFSYCTNGTNFPSGTILHKKTKLFIRVRANV